MSKREVKSFLPSAHTPVLQKVSLLNYTLEGTAVSFHQIFSEPPSVKCCSTQFLCIYLLFLASWMMLSNPHKIHQLIGRPVNNKSERM
jgi:hypothetical protein